MKISCFCMSGLRYVQHVTYILNGCFMGFNDSLYLNGSNYLWKADISISFRFDFINTVGTCFIDDILFIYLFTYDIPRILNNFSTFIRNTLTLYLFNPNHLIKKLCTSVCLSVCLSVCPSVRTSRHITRER